jgi:hypothetical protein
MWLFKKKPVRPLRLAIMAAPSLGMSRADASASAVELAKRTGCDIYGIKIYYHADGKTTEAEFPQEK